MNAEFNQDGLEQGYARLILTFEDGDAKYAPGDGIAIGRQLGGDDWEYVARKGDGSMASSPEPLKLKTKPEEDGDNVTFELQPAYVDRMEDGPYFIKLLGPDGSEKGESVFVVDNVVWSGLDSTGTLKDYTEAEADMDRRKEEEAARKEAGEEARRARERAAAAAAAAVKQAPEDDTASIEDHEKVVHDNADTEAERNYVENMAISETQEAQREQTARAEMDLAAPELDEPAPKSKKGIVLAAIIILLIAVGGGGFYIWKSQNDAREAARLAAEAQAKMEAEHKAARANARGRVAAFFAGQRTPEGAMSLAKDLDADTPEQKDAIFRLYYYAAGQDNPEGALRYAECVDPSRPAWGTVQKDGVEAWTNYGKSPEGEQARAALKEWTQKAAAGGDAKAAEWLGHME